MHMQVEGEIVLDSKILYCGFQKDEFEMSKLKKNGATGVPFCQNHFRCDIFIL